MAPSKKTIAFLSTVAVVGGLLGKDQYTLRKERQSLIFQAQQLAKRPMGVYVEPKRYKWIVDPREGRDLFHDFARSVLNAAYVEYEVVDARQPGDPDRLVTEWLTRSDTRPSCDGIIAVGEPIFEQVLWGLVHAHGQQTLEKPSSSSLTDLPILNDTCPVGLIPLPRTHFFQRIRNYFDDTGKMRLLGEAALSIADGQSTLVSSAELAGHISHPSLLPLGDLPVQFRIFLPTVHDRINPPREPDE